MPPARDDTADLTRAMERAYYRAADTVGYRGTRFLAQVRRLGGLKTAKLLLRPRRNSDVSPGFRALLEHQRSDLTIEHLVVHGRFRHLFTAEELAEAERRLKAVLPAHRPRRRAPEEVFPDDLAESASFHEGAVRRVTVNAYERDARARRACIKALGATCAVCQFDFERVYGEIGRGFIHVHHVRPIALRRKRYRVEPTRDLVPVCPNCHAMLHVENPPLEVDRLREILAQQRQSGGHAGSDPAAAATGTIRRPAPRKGDAER